jgi:hypothetical protein
MTPRTVSRYILSFELIAILLAAFAGCARRPVNVGADKDKSPRDNEGADKGGKAEAHPGQLLRRPQPSPRGR